MDVVVTVPKNFSYGGLRGLAAWCAEGDCAGEAQDSGEQWIFSTWGVKPEMYRGDRVYIVCEDRLRGYAPIVDLRFREIRHGQGHLAFIREGGAEAVTIHERITGFRGWRYRWWKREDEVPFPDWRTTDVRKQPKPRRKRTADRQMSLF
jgi:hypothetical protein